LKYRLQRTLAHPCSTPRAARKGAGAQWEFVKILPDSKQRLLRGGLGIGLLIDLYRSTY